MGDTLRTRPTGAMDRAESGLEVPCAAEAQPSPALQVPEEEDVGATNGEAPSLLPTQGLGPAFVPDRELPS